MSVVKAISIIDDDPVFVFGMKKMLELSGFCNNFLEYNNGKDALAELKQLSNHPETFPGIIFVDTNMPVMDGWEFLDKLFKLTVPDHVKVYLISSSSAISDQKKAEKIPQLAGYIIKPFTLDQLKVLQEVF